MDCLKTNWIMTSVALLVTVFTFAQQPSETEQQIRTVFPDRPAVFVERSLTLHLSVEGDSLKAYADAFEDIVHLTSTSDAYADGKVYGSSFNHVTDLKAKTLVWEKNRYREIPVNSFKKNAGSAGGVFYDDTYYYSFNYPAVASGNRTQLQYREVLKDMRFHSGYMFSSYLPQMRSLYTIRAPKDVNLHFETFNDPAGKIKFRKVEKGNTVVYEWRMDLLDALSVDDGSPSLRYYAPHVVTYVKSFRSKSGEQHILPDVNALHEWYRSFTAIAVEDQPSEELQSVVNEITNRHKDENEIAKAVFYWVQDNINYIAFEEGMRGFIPRKPSYTCEKKYGDCKDMANLIVGMLRMAGIDAYTTWIGSRKLPYRYSLVPTPLSDDHMIAAYISKDGVYYFLDATGRYTPFGFPTAMIQGKEALISYGPGKFEVKEILPVEASRNLVLDSMSLSLDQNILKGKGVSRLYGLAKADAGSYLERVGEKEIRHFVLRVVGKGNNKFLLDNYQLTNWEKRDEPTRISYQFSIGDYCQRVGNELYINLNLSKENYNRAINTDVRKTPHEMEFMYTKNEVIEFVIPDGYEVEYLPANDSFEGGLIGYKAEYKLEGNRIYCHQQGYVSYLLLQPDEFKTWNKEVGKVSSMYQETVILKKKI